MDSKNSTILATLLCAALVALPTPGWSTVTTIDYSPTSARVTSGQSGSISIRWTINSTDAPSTVISSPAGYFHVNNSDGVVLGTTGPISRSVSGDPSITATITEHVFIPSSVIYQAIKHGASRIAYERLFVDSTSGGTTAYYPIDITSSAAAGFGISRFALSFEDGAIEKVAEEQQFLRAKAVVKYTGSGVIRGTWEVADPSSTAGTPVYRPLTQLHEFLPAGGDKTLLSPQLPTDRSGLYLVRLNVSDPTLFDSAPVLRYFVQPRPAPREPITQIAPPHLSLLGKGTHFAWQPIAGVRAYQLELFEQGLPAKLPDEAAPLDQPRPLDPRPGATISPTAGLLIPGDQTSVPLTALARNHLTSGRAYLWRVLAIGPEGNVIGESPLRAIRVP